MRDEGEPISPGQLDRRAADKRALRDAFSCVAFFGGVMLINGIVVILLIELAQTLGWWPMLGGEPTSIGEWRLPFPGRPGSPLGVASLR